MQNYVERVIAQIRDTEKSTRLLGARFERAADSIYLGGGTPTTLPPESLEAIFSSVRDEFDLAADAEVTVECAPGTLSPQMLDCLRRCGVNRMSLGVQSFVDRESHAVGRTHTRASVAEDIARLRDAGISNISVDLIAGLPHQTRESWLESLHHAVAAGVPHVSVYLLEVDDESRLGQELIAGGTRYHAHHVPDDDLCAELYSTACERLNAAGILQYEISNFARPGFESKHNLKYWTRQPYLGFGLDAHSMLLSGPTSSHNAEAAAAVRFSTPDDLDVYLAADSGAPRFRESHCVTRREAVEEELFLGLRLNRGVDIGGIEQKLGLSLTAEQSSAVEQLTRDGLLRAEAARLALTDRGRLLSNEVFARLIADKAPAIV